MTLEVTILSNLIYNEEYTRKVLPFLKQDYFTVRSYKVIFLEIHEYVSNYNTLPCLNALGIECQERTDLSEEQFKEIMGGMMSFMTAPPEISNGNQFWKFEL